MKIIIAISFALIFALVADAQTDGGHKAIPTDPFASDTIIKQIDTRLAAIAAQYQPMLVKSIALEKVIEAKSHSGSESSSETAALKDLHYRMIPLNKEKVQLTAKRKERIAVLQLQQIK